LPNVPTPALAIDPLRDRVIEALQPERPLVVAAPTGSGKSTRLPVWLHEATGGEVLVVQPRRVACRALALWLAQQHGQDVGETFGYRVRFEDHLGSRTRVAFVTPGVALGLLSDARASRYAVVLIDEFHERGWEVDLLVALLRERLRRGGPRLVLCSATLDIDGLCERLGAEAVIGEGRAFPVDIAYVGDGPPSSQDLPDRVADAVRDALRGDQGDVLVFLPGKAEIERCDAALRGVSALRVPVHGSLPPQALTRAFAASGQRRVFLATNVAETSLTLPGVTTVIDSGLCRMRVHQSGRSVLGLVPISVASMQQRAGRAGRVVPGRCIRLWASHYVAEPSTAPEIERIELDDVILRAAAGGMVGEAFEAAPWVTPPPAFAVKDARARLHRQGVIDAQGRLTGRGRAQSALPVSGFGARILNDAPPELAPALADLVALLELRRDLLLPASGGDGHDDARQTLFAGATDEVTVQLRCLWRGDPARHGLHAGALTEARRLAASLRRMVGADEDCRSEARGLPVATISHLLQRIPETAFVLRERSRRSRDERTGLSREPWGNGAIELALRPYAVPGSFPEQQPPPARAGLVLEAEWLGVGRRARGVGRMLLRCTIDDLVDAGLGEWSFANPRLRREGRTREVVADSELRHANVVLQREIRPLEGEPLRAALARLVLEGRLRKGLGALLLDDVHLWQLAVAWVGLHGPGSSTDMPKPPSTALDYLHERLGVVGVEQLADLDLLEDADLRPPLEAVGLAGGLDPRALASLAEDLPRRCTVPGHVLVCTVDVRRRLVVLEPLHPHTRGDPSPKFLPRFRGFGVEYQKASRTIRLR
jgi:ATP-dependent helicase HrpB